MKERACATRSCIYILNVFQAFESLCWPIKSSIIFGARHLGQGHSPLSRTIANKTLVNSFSTNAGRSIGRCTFQGNRQSKWRTVDRHGVWPHQHTWWWCRAWMHAQMHHLGEGSTRHELVRDDSALGYPSVACSTSYGMLPQSCENGQGAKQVWVSTSWRF